MASIAVPCPQQVFDAALPATVPSVLHRGAAVSRKVSMEHRDPAAVIGRDAFLLLLGYRRPAWAQGKTLEPVLSGKSISIMRYTGQELVCPSTDDSGWRTFWGGDGYRTALATVSTPADGCQARAAGAPDAPGRLSENKFRTGEDGAIFILAVDNS
ncbi:hypothetical protein BDV93DRAFT_556041 [Ceratobasidium sp. AG-I]|nr:hypothetical protein BDV93DRAFT_556041 [Ceratobasidium sp. AG-I]